jgi:hypothetical protein
MSERVVKIPGHPANGLRVEIIRVHEDDGESAPVVEVKLLEEVGCYRLGERLDLAPWELTPIIMAKKTKAPVAEPQVAAPAATTDAPAAVKTRTEVNSTFTRVYDPSGKPVPPTSKLAPQAQCILNGVEAAGKDGITRENLVKALTGVLVTRQPVGRIISYYQKTLVASGAVTMANP